MWMPDLNQRTQALYGFQFGLDGYPEREGVASPLYGAYAINDYLQQHQSTAEDKYSHAALRVALAALERMESWNDALVFYYGGEAGVQSTRNLSRHYSGLTQSYYLAAFQKLAELDPQGPWSGAAERIFRSLLIPASEGGVLYMREDGVIIAQTPRQPEDVVLNGWITAALHLRQYAVRAKSVPARRLLKATIAALERYLPIFDVPALANTRYSSAGYALFRLVLPSSRQPYKVRNVALRIPAEPTYSIDAREGTRWDLHTLAADWEGIFLKRRSLRLNLVLNRLAYPDVNSLSLDIESFRSGDAILEFRHGDYSPKAAAATANQHWVEIARAPIVRGWNHVDFAIDWTPTELVAYPTNFLKQRGGKYYNHYHWLHVTQLERLARVTRSERLGDYAAKWRGYLDHWPHMGVYANVEPSPLLGPTVRRDAGQL